KYYIRLSIPFIIAGIAMFAFLYYPNYTGNISIILLLKILIGAVIYGGVLLFYTKFVDSEIFRLLKDWRNKTDD
ncbi:TPA: hypothetical protein ACHVH4_002318, partial [Streptococcus suis]